ncbi:MAG: hypothetical protein HC769_09295 [Cyanobacteria bacterium CRU_2_1]|nr:hypothetical protein [Cyanobacteria bacterium RU_5_0]NJR59023.1 hypothetical protein [Cyanobacteria bacterium CRU_2_1]
MASPNQVKRYLAYWFQLGKPLVVPGQQMVLPQPVMQGNHYSPEFEACWQQVLESSRKDCYLEGTIQTIAELLSPSWEVTACARCEMPVPMFSLGMQEPDCPCADIPSWPNTELPQPRSPVDSGTQLSQIRDRLRFYSQQPNPRQSGTS